MPFNQIAYKDEDDYANVDVYHKKYDRICFCCNEDLTTAHVSHRLFILITILMRMSSLFFLVRPREMQFLPEIVQVAQQFGTTSFLVAFGQPGFSVRVLQCDVFDGECAGRTHGPA